MNARGKRKEQKKPKKIMNLGDNGVCGCFLFLFHLGNHKLIHAVNTPHTLHTCPPYPSANFLPQPSEDRRIIQHRRRASDPILQQSREAVEHKPPTWNG